VRVNKYISEAGLCSRREADELLIAGRVTINDEVVGTGAKALDGDVVKVDGEVVVARTVAPASAKSKAVYIALYKPVGVTCTTDKDVDGNIVDFVDHAQRIFPIGRLDKDSEGLILLTNNGDIVNGILRAEHDHEKEYIVELDRPVTDIAINILSGGVRILGVTTKPCRVSKINQRTLRMVLTQGLNRQIRRMCSSLGYQVRRLQRVRIMNIHLGQMGVGKWRLLTEAEIKGLARPALAKQRR
jgi:23S rRNA pseudouridine2604 synthase